MFAELHWLAAEVSAHGGATAPGADARKQETGPVAGRSTAVMAVTADSGTAARSDLLKATQLFLSRFRLGGTVTFVSTISDCKFVKVSQDSNRLNSLAPRPR